MEFLHGFTTDRVHCIAGETSGTSVPETAVDFICGRSFSMVPVEQIGPNTFLAREYRFRSFRPCTKTIYEQTTIDYSWENIPEEE